MAFQKGNDPYFKKLFLDSFRTQEEAEEQASNTDEFAMWLTANPEKSEPLFKWFFNFYFNGIDENAQAILFEDDLVRCARAGITKPLFLDVTAQGSVEHYSLFGVMCMFFKEPYDLDKTETDYVDGLLEEIRIKSDLFTWKKCDWEYFREKHWYTVISDVLNKLASDFNTLKDSFLVKDVQAILEQKRVGIPFEFIAKDDNYDPPHSGYGLDCSKFFYHSKPLVVQLKESECTHRANSDDSDLAKQSSV